MAFATTHISSCLSILIIFVFNTTNAHTISDKYGLGVYYGHPINITEVPFMAIYRRTGRPWGCGASIVHEQFLVTACCCVQAYGVKGEVVVGTDNIHEGKKYEIEKAVCHPKFDEDSLDYDLGVLKLKNKLTLGKTVNIIKMADSSVVLKKGDVYNTIGFGKTEDNKNSDILLAIDISFVDHHECNKNLSSEITDRMICAGGGSPYHGTSYGDAGGALRFNDLLIGSDSWGSVGTQPNTPNVFASIPSMREFIDKTIANNI